MPTSKPPAKGLTPPQKLTPGKRKLVASGAKARAFPEPSTAVLKPRPFKAGERRSEAPASKGISTAGLKPRPFKAQGQNSRAGAERRPQYKKAAGLLAPERVGAILEELGRLYPEAECALRHRNAFELVIATALSAQTTDVNVNKVTPELFRMYPTPKWLAEASLAEIEEIIHSTGFYRAKARNIRGAARVLVERFGGRVPQTIGELIQLPGVARKTANVVLGCWYEVAEGVVVDTHVLRLSQRLGLTKATDPKKVEQELMRILPRERWIQFSHEMIYHGRQVCVARRPRCVDCGLERVCRSVDKTWSSDSERR